MRAATASIAQFLESWLLNTMRDLREPSFPLRVRGASKEKIEPGERAFPSIVNSYSVLSPYPRVVSNTVDESHAGAQTLALKLALESILRDRSHPVYLAMKLGFALPRVCYRTKRLA